MPTTPPRGHFANSAPPALDTPHRKRESSHIDGDGQMSVAHRSEMYSDLFAEISHHIYADVPSFPDTFFGPYLPAGNLLALASQRDLYDPIRKQWTTFPNLGAPRQALVTSWLTSDINPLLATAHPHRSFPFQTPPGSYYFSGGPSGMLRCTDVLVSGLDSLPPGADTHDWRNIRVVGELKENRNMDLAKDTTMQVADYARLVLYAQPTRHAVHLFTLCGTLMRCWVVDRMGMIASMAFDIHSEPIAFLRAALFYTTADAVALGFDPTVTAAEREFTPGPPSLTPTTTVTPEPSSLAPMTKTTTTTYRWTHPEHPQVYDPTVIPVPELGNVVLPSIEVPAAEGDGRQRLVLEPLALFATAGVVSRGSTCWRARPLEAAVGKQGSDDDWTLAVKSQWRDVARESEGVMLKLARGIAGVAQYYSHEDVVVEGQVVDVLGCVRKHIQLPPECRKRYRRAMEQVQTVGTVDSKRRKLSVDDEDRDLNADEDQDKDRDVDVDKDQDEDKDVSERGEEKVGGKGRGAAISVISNRVLTRVVMSSLGKPLLEYERVSQVLGAFEDTIKAHRSLLLEKKILHRDISLHNIMLDASSPEHGFLIDLDFATLVPRQSESEAVHRTGTPPFMAIDILLGKTPHTYRHDLESFLYVLLWLCTFYPPSSATPISAAVRREKKMNRLSRLTWEEQAFIKMGYMNQCFEMLIDEFHHSFRKVKVFPKLARKWRQILFPSPSGNETGKSEGSDAENDSGDPSRLYEGMLDALAQARKNLPPDA